MTELETNVTRIQLAAQRAGFRKLALRADVPYSTLKAFANRGWRNKNVEVYCRLTTAAEQLLQEMEDLAPAD